MVRRILSAGDDRQQFSIVKDYSGGQNSKLHGSIIKPNQATVLTNVDISTPGETKKRPGIDLAEDLGNDAGYGAFGFNVNGGTNELVVVHGQKLETTQNPKITAFSERKTDFVAGTDCTIIKAGEESENDVLLIKIDGNNWFRMLQDYTFQDLGSTTGTASDSPYDSNAALWFRQRLWILKGNFLYWSDPFPADFSTAFNTADAFRVDVGADVGLASIRDTGILVFGSEAVYGINPSISPAATDKVEKLLDIGCVSRRSIAQVGDDILFLSNDGVRGLFRSQQDKLQTGSSYPISYSIDDEIDNLNPAYLDMSCGIFYDNKYFLACTSSGSTYNDKVLVYYPDANAWTVIDGWNVGAWAKVIISGEERLYYIDSNDGSVYRAWTGYSDAGVKITYTEEGRKDDLGQPLIKKTGGEVWVKAYSSGNYTLSVYASADDNEYVLLGTMTLTDGEAPTLPIELPFDLAGKEVITETFHLDSLGDWNQLRIKIEHDALNGSDDIIIYERSIITYTDEYQSESEE